MIRLKKYIFIGMTALMATSCSDFLDTVPKDALSPSTTWKTETDAQKFLVGCYDGWEDGAALLYWDAGSDYAYNNFPWEGFTNIGNGSLSASDPGWSFYDFTTIRRCNTFLQNIDKVSFANDADKKDMAAQARAIRAYRYFIMNWNYGGVPIISNYASADEAKVPRNSEAEVRAYIAKELDECTPDLKDAPAARGNIAKGAAYAIRMREALYYNDWAKAKEMAQKIIDLGQYSLDADYSNIFNVSGQSSPEIILAVQYINNTKALGTIGQLYNNGDGGWSSVVPTQNLVNTYEMKTGMTKDEAGSGYDATHPFANRDPRLAKTVIFPGRDYVNADGKTAVFNTLDKTIGGATNANYYGAADNAAKTGLTWAKYLDPITQYSDIWATNCCPIVFRYAEVLLTYAEAENELNGPSADVYKYINMVRNRAGMPNVDETKYNTKETLRELIHRERSVEFAGEGLRRADILRWNIAGTVLNGVLNRMVGTVDMTGTNPETRATINTAAAADEMKIENRTFDSHNRYLPIPQSALDKNPNLKQNTGY